MEISRQEIQQLMDDGGGKFLRLIFDRYKELFESALPAKTISSRITADLERPLSIKQVYNIRMLYQNNATRRKRKKVVPSMPVSPPAMPVKEVVTTPPIIKAETPPAPKKDLSSILSQSIEDRDAIKKKRLGLSDNENQ